MANVAERIRWAYEGERIPYDTFSSGVPFALRTFEDNKVLPFFGTVQAPDGTKAKWIKFSEFLPFEDACKVYWMDAENFEHPLYIYVMPYTPLQDCHYLSDLLDAPPVQDDEADEIEYGQMQQDMEIEEEDAAHVTEGHTEVANGVFIYFRVVNANLLWSKVRQYRRLMYIADPLQHYLYQMDAYTPELTVEKGYNLLLAADEARGRLVLALMDQFMGGKLESDPHDAVLSIYPQMHNQIYTNICPYCDLKQQHTDFLSDAVMHNLESARMELHDRFQVNNALSICQEEFNLMSAEGSLVVHNLLTDMNNLLCWQVRAQLQELRNKTTSDTLAGVLVDYEDGNNNQEVEDAVDEPEEAVDEPEEH